MKKLFLVFLVLLAGMSGLSATPPGKGGADDAPQVVMPQVGITISAPKIGTPISGSSFGINAVFYQPTLSLSPILFVDFIMAPDDTTAFTEDIELICLWSEQRRQGLLTQDEFKTLVAGRIAVMRMRDQTLGEGMKALAEKTRKKVDRLLMCRELKLGIQHTGSLPGGWCAIAH